MLDFLHVFEKRPELMVGMKAVFLEFINLRKSNIFCIVSPQESWTEHEKMIALSEEFYQSLQLPYQIINIVSES